MATLRGGHEYACPSVLSLEASALQLGRFGHLLSLGK